MKRLSILPRWLILATVVFLGLVLTKDVFPAEIPRETVQCMKHLARDDYRSFAKFCADTVLFGQAFTGNCTEMVRKELVRFLKRNGLSRENRDLFREFPKDFKINWDRKKGELICYRFSRPFAWLVFRQEKEIWRLTVLGVYFPERKIVGQLKED